MFRPTNRLLVYWWINRNHPQPFAHDFPLKASKPYEEQVVVDLCLCSVIQYIPVSSSNISPMIHPQFTNINHGIFGMDHFPYFQIKHPQCFPPKKHGFRPQLRLALAGAMGRSFVAYGPFLQSHKVDNSPKMEDDLPPLFVHTHDPPCMENGWLVVWNIFYLSIYWEQ